MESLKEVKDELKSLGADVAEIKRSLGRPLANTTAVREESTKNGPPVRPTPEPFNIRPSDVGWDLEGAGESLYSAGRFLEALPKFQEAVSHFSADDNREAWATTQGWLGNCYSAIAESSNADATSHYYLDAVAAYADTMSVYTRKAFPELWAFSKCNLGFVLDLQGQREGDMQGVEHLDASVSAFRDALQIFTPGSPDWAKAQTALGSALCDRGWRVKDVERIQSLDEGIDAFSAALTVFTPLAHPEDSKSVRGGLFLEGEALIQKVPLVADTDSVKLLFEAEKIFRILLSVLTPQGTTTEWAEAEKDLGLVLHGQGIRSEGGEGVRLIKESVEALQSALAVIARDGRSVEWAIGQGYLGKAFENLGNDSKNEERNEFFKKSIDSYRTELAILTAKEQTKSWVFAQANLGGVLEELGTRTQGTEGVALLQQSAQAFRAALTVYTKETTSEEWATEEFDLGAVLQIQSDRLGGINKLLLVDAASALKASLEVFTLEKYPKYHAMAAAHLATVEVAMWRD